MSISEPELSEPKVVSLINIWCDYQNRDGSQDATAAPPAPALELPEPPMLRENLKREIDFLARALEEKV